MSKKDDKLKAQEAYTEIPNDRPNKPAHPIILRDCLVSRTGMHDFSMKLPSPPGSNIALYGCWYCSKKSPRSEARLAEWQQQNPLPKPST